MVTSESTEELSSKAEDITDKFQAISTYSYSLENWFISTSHFSCSAKREYWDPTTTRNRFWPIAMFLDFNLQILWLCRLHAFQYVLKKHYFQDNTAGGAKVVSKSRKFAQPLYRFCRLLESEWFQWLGVTLRITGLMDFAHRPKF
jgi:hypothetical protein